MATTRNWLGYDLLCAASVCILAAGLVMLLGWPDHGGLAAIQGVLTNDRQLRSLFLANLMVSFPFWLTIATVEGKRRFGRGFLWIGGGLAVLFLGLMMVRWHSDLAKASLLLLLLPLVPVLRAGYQKEWWLVFAGMVVLPVVTAIGFSGLFLWLIDVRMDRQLAQVELLTGAHYITELFASFGVLDLPIMFPLLLVYQSLAMMVAACLGLAAAGVLPRQIAPIRLLACLPIIALATYCLLPATGPGYVFQADEVSLTFLRAWDGDFPAIVGDKFRLYNCYPSFHVAIAMAGWFLLRHLGRAGAVFGAVFTAMTLVSAIATGEHYVSDMVASPAAFGLALALFGLRWPDGVWRERLRAGVVFVGLMLPLPLGLRFLSLDLVAAWYWPAALGILVVSGWQIQVLLAAHRATWGCVDGNTAWGASFGVARDRLVPAGSS